MFDGSCCFVDTGLPSHTVRGGKQVGVTEAKMHVERRRWECRFVLNPNLSVSAFSASYWFRTVCLTMIICRPSESGH